MSEKLTGLEVAVIGMSCKFPDANSIEEYWENLKKGKESITFLTKDELKEVSDLVSGHPNYVSVKGGVINEAHMFDESFFGYTPNEAKVMDPQIRLMHELSWEALEDAGYNSFDYKGSIGLFASATQNTYWEIMSANSSESNKMGKFAANGLASKESIGTLIAYKLNLKGPVVFLSSACSSSLVAIHSATRALLGGECNIAMAAGISVSDRPNNGYIYQQGMVLSSDGHCKAFDDNSDGTVAGQGGGVVVLKLLEEAIEDGDNIHAIIKGSAINNDGSQKIGYTAPSFQGQEKVIKQALQMAEVSPESIGYVETHGTGTILGDPIEIQALTSAFNTNKKGFCAIGSVKTNIGHTDIAAGMAGFVKTVLSLKNQALIPSLNFNKANSKIKFEDSPFFVNTQLQTWIRDKPLRAGVSSFGIGGTNAHVILEEYQKESLTTSSREFNIMSISAKSENALEAQLRNLRDHLEQKEVFMDDVCYTLHVGRQHHKHRKSIVFANNEDIIKIFDKDEKWFRGITNGQQLSPVFLFSGQGTQYLNYGKDLYFQYPIFRNEVDTCAEIIKNYSGQEIRNYILDTTGDQNLESTIYNQSISQPLLFTIEYALTKQLENWGITPSHMIGHSIGEYVAAFFAGVFELEEVLRLIVFRGELMEKLPHGVMLYVPLEEQKLKSLLPSEISIAIVNEPGCVVAGTEQDVTKFENQLREKRIITMRLDISHAGHSSLLEPMLEDFKKELDKITLRAPNKPFVSNLTGQWINTNQATNPQYWVDHIKSTVRLSDGIKTLCDLENAFFLEIGPGNTLSSALSRLNVSDKPARVLSFSQPKNRSHSEVKFILSKLAELWTWGVDIDWKLFYEDDQILTRRISLPTYPFERKVFELEKLDLGKFVHDPDKRDPLFTNWFYSPEWKRKNNASNNEIPENTDCIFFNEGGDTGVALRNKLQSFGNVFSVYEKGNSISESYPDHIVQPNEDYTNLFEEIGKKNAIPKTIIFYADLEVADLNEQSFNKVQEKVFYKLLKLIKACGNHEHPKRIIIVTNGLHDVIGTENPNPALATFLGLMKVVNQEYGHLKCCNIDFHDILSDFNKNVKILLNEVENVAIDRIVAFRGIYRWVQSFEPCISPEFLEKPSKLKHSGTYILLGGLGNIGFVIAEYLAKNYHANLIISGRTILPDRSEWESLIKNEDTPVPIRSRLMKIIKLEDIGSQVKYYSANITDKDQMNDLIENSVESFNEINGVIYGVTNIDENQKKLISEISKDQVESQFDTKVRGLLILDEVTKNISLDFCLLMSSSSSILGGLGFSAYSAANIFMDFFAQYQNRLGKKHYVSYNSSGWMHYDEKLTIPIFDSSDYNFKMTCQEGCDAIETALKFDSGSQIIAYLSDFNYQLKNWVNIDDIGVEEKLENEQHRAARPVLLNDYVPPINDTQMKLAKLWSDIFGFFEVGIEDDFFEIGGDSLKAIKLISRIEIKLNKTILLKELLNERTIENIAKIIDAKESSGYKRIPQSEKKEYYSLSSAQKRLYFLQKTQPDSISYNEQILIEIEGKFSIEMVQGIIEKLIKRHEVLRTSFIEYDGIPYQKIQADAEVDVELIKSEGNNDQVIRDFIKPFSLDHPPFVRILLVEVELNKHIMMIDQHHILTDGISFYIFKREFYALLNNMELNANDYHYKDFSEWQSRQLNKGVLKKQELFWNNKFQNGFINTELTKNESPQKHPPRRGVILTQQIGIEETLRFQKILKSNKTTIFNGLLAVLNVLLSKVSRQNQINILSPVLGRKRDELQDILGVFINMIILNNTVEQDMSFENFLSIVNINTLEAFENDEYPFEELVKKLKQKSEDFKSPEFDVLFTIKNLKEEETSQEYNENLQFKYYDLDVYQPKYGLEIAFEETADNINMLFIYDSYMYSEITMDKIKNYFFLILNHILENPKVLINEIILEQGLEEISDVEVEKLFGGFDF